MKKAAIFDFNRTLFDPTVYSLYPGVATMLDELREQYRLFLYSRRMHDREELLKRLGIDECFEAAYFVPRKNKENLEGILKDHGLDVSNTIVIGDLLEDELQIANDLGMETVWMKHGLVAPAMTAAAHRPTHTANTIPELHRLLEKWN